MSLLLRKLFANSRTSISVIPRLSANFSARSKTIQSSNINFCNSPHRVSNFRSYCSNPNDKFALNDSNGQASEAGSVASGASLGSITPTLRIIYTCKVCGSREQKEFSKQAYTTGVVLVQCSSCENRHLIADNLGWFSDKSKNIEDILREKGEAIKTGISVEGSIEDN